MNKFKKNKCKVKVKNLIDGNKFKFGIEDENFNTKRKDDKCDSWQAGSGTKCTLFMWQHLKRQICRSHSCSLY